MAAMVNLIPFNPFPGAPYQRSKPEVIAAFSKILRDRKVFATTRKTRGDDIDAACGQLVGKVVSKQKNRLSGIPVVVFDLARSEEHTSELQSLMSISYAVFCLEKQNIQYTH